MSNFSYFVTPYLQVVAVRPFFMHALSCTLTLTHTREITIAMCISCVSGCSCCSFVAIITRISTTFFQNFWTCISKYVRVCVYSTRNQMVVIYTCLYVPLYHYSMIIIILLQKVSSRLFLIPIQTASIAEPTIYGRFACDVPFSLCLRKRIVANFFLLFWYRILFHCPLQRKSFNFFLLFHCIVSFSPSSYQIKCFSWQMLRTCIFPRC